MTPEAKAKSAGFLPNVISGLATGLFSIPEGMAYAQLAGVNPVYGMYSGILATIVSSLSTGTVLMMSTLTSPIALTTASVMQNAGIQNSQLPVALFTITLSRVLDVENQAWEAAQEWLSGRQENTNQPADAG